MSNMDKKRTLLQNICIYQAQYMQQIIQRGKTNVMYV